jgi:hypothetical protein
VAQYLDRGKLEVLGFVKEGGKFVLYRTIFDKRTRLNARRRIGWVRLDAKGYVKAYNGLPTDSKGNLCFYFRF